jgi:hypothetical protein
MSSMRNLKKPTNRIDANAIPTLRAFGVYTALAGRDQERMHRATAHWELLRDLVALQGQVHGLLIRREGKAEANPG